ncbi:ABC transporter permease [Arthrobacter sp. GCM10027362]|uniref:ABC transporter permease n=1 Tax=Arthrobacter sp. GCM10027362 TaxID=3273379 RepID=UPI00362E0335
MTTIKSPKFLLGVLSLVLALAAWEAVAQTGRFGNTIPPMWETLGRLGEMLGDKRLWAAIWDTLVISLAGFFLAIVLGVAAGIAIGTSHVLHHATRAALEFLKPIPVIVILPVVVLVLGPKFEMSLFLVVFGCALPILIQTAAGVADTDPVALDTARSYGMGKFETLVRIILPSAMAFIASSVRICAPGALMIAVVAGLFGGGPGIGRTLLRATSAGAHTDVFAIVVITGLLGLAFQSGSVLLEKKIMHWHPSQRTEIAS